MIVADLRIRGERNNKINVVGKISGEDFIKDFIEILSKPN